MGDVIDFASHQKVIAGGNGKPARITFHSPQFSKSDQPHAVSVTVEVGDGDVLGILGAVRENGGIWAEQEPGYRGFIPWPCAYVGIEFTSGE